MIQYILTIEIYNLLFSIAYDFSFVAQSVGWIIILISLSYYEN